MEASKVATIGVAILLVVTGTGFGIAQAEGNRSERPVSSFEEMAFLDPGGSSASSVETRPVLSFADQSENPIETGSISATQFEEPWMKEYGHD